MYNSSQPQWVRVVYLKWNSAQFALEISLSHISQGEFKINCIVYMKMNVKSKANIYITFSPSVYIINLIVIFGSYNLPEGQEFSLFLLINVKNQM